jgi:hypothetical protein
MRDVRCCYMPFALHAHIDDGRERRMPSFNLRPCSGAAEQNEEGEGGGRGCYDVKEKNDGRGKLHVMKASAI